MRSSMHIPLAERLRPNALEEVVGQEHLIGNQGLLSKIVEQRRPFSSSSGDRPDVGKQHWLASMPKPLRHNLLQ